MRTKEEKAAFAEGFAFALVIARKSIDAAKEIEQKLHDEWKMPLILEGGFTELGAVRWIDDLIEVGAVKRAPSRGDPCQ